MNALLAPVRRPAPPSPLALPDTQGRPPRVVLDTAAVVTALMFGGGTAARLRSAWQTGLCRPLACKATALDLGAQLAHPRLGLTANEQQTLLGDYLPYVLKVRVPQADQPSVPDEPAALNFVRLAMAGRAHALISADAPMLALAHRFPFAVLALDAFLAALDASAITPIPKSSRYASVD